MKFSVIIPAYNCGQYIKECIKSILNTTFKDFEIICVDDGSTDNTKEEIFSIKDPKIHYVYQENSGVSDSRNHGISLAKGEYLLFVDADDTVKQDYFMELISSIDNNPDIVLFGYDVIGSNNRKSDLQLLKTISVNQVVNHLLDEHATIYGYVWRACFKRDFLNRQNLLFRKDIKISEDFLFLFEASYKAKVINIIPISLYEYRINSNSVTTKYIKTLKENMESINDIIVDEISFSEELSNTFNGMILNTLIRIVQNYSRYYNCSSTYKLTKKTLKENRYNRLVKDAIKYKKYMSRKIFISILFFKFKFVYLYILIFKFKNKLWAKQKINGIN